MFNTRKTVAKKEKKGWKEMHQNEQRLSPQGEALVDYFSLHNFPSFEMSMSYFYNYEKRTENLELFAFNQWAEAIKSRGSVTGHQVLLLSRGAELAVAVWAGRGPRDSLRGTGPCSAQEPSERSLFYL